MLEFVPYQPWHLSGVALQPAQSHLRALIDRPGYAESLASPRAWTGLLDGEVVGCAGLSSEHEHRDVAWAIMGIVPRWYWTQIVMFVRSNIRRLGARRVEMHVETNFSAGCRLAMLLGFKVEGRMEKFGPDGLDYYMFAKVA